jgi:hypothetical protein
MCILWFPFLFLIYLSTNHTRWDTTHTVESEPRREGEREREPYNKGKTPMNDVTSSALHFS